MVRYNPDMKYGLTYKEVEERVKNKLLNVSEIPKTKTIKQIVLSHIFTLFNILNICLGICICLVESYRNLLFLGVVFCNTIIGIYQEIRAKRIVDKLSLISESKVNVIRNGKKEAINIEDVVLDDITEYKLGNQIVADSIILSGSCEVNESFLTGEADSIVKKRGDYIFSGSYIVRGSVVARVDKIGKDNYISTISSGAKFIKKVDSEIITTINKIIKILSITIIPMGIILFIKQITLPDNDLASSVVNTVAALIGMIPEGLVLLTSSVFAVSIIRLSKYNVLVQELYCIENLARIDTLCLDKTGTITEGIMELYDIIPFNSYSKNDLETYLEYLCSNLDNDNATMEAINKIYGNKVQIKADKTYSFSSEKKYSGIEINGTTYLIGAPDYLLNETDKIKLEKYNEENRVLALVKLKNFDGLDYSNNTLVGIILLRDKIRDSAIKTLEFFREQNISIKVISGDNPMTVSSIAKRVGIINADKYIDASSLVTKKDIQNAVDKYTIFGRVKPNQKKEIIKSLQKNGHFVGYVGDGVNDVLALKSSDCSITFQNGSEAARNISNLVLLDSNFSGIPKIVSEGRRSINNIQRSSSLFLVKTIYSCLLSIIFLFLNESYPFIPIQLTLTSVVTIGIPSFVLALEPNKEKVSGHFFPNVISKSLPAALTIVANILITMIVRDIFKFTDIETSTICVLLTGLTGFILLYRLCKPFNIIRGILLTLMITIFAFGILGFRNIFYLATITPYMLLVVLSLTVLSYIIFNVMMNLIDKHIIPKINK